MLGIQSRLQSIYHRSHAELCHYIWQAKDGETETETMGSQLKMKENYKLCPGMVVNFLVWMYFFLLGCILGIYSN